MIAVPLSIDPGPFRSHGESLGNTQIGGLFQNDREAMSPMQTIDHTAYPLKPQGRAGSTASAGQVLRAQDADASNRL